MLHELGLIKRKQMVSPNISQKGISITSIMIIPILKFDFFQCISFYFKYYLFICPSRVVNCSLNF